MLINIIICVLLLFLLVLAVMSTVIVIGMSGLRAPDALSAWRDAEDPSRKNDFRRQCRDAHRMQKCLFPMHLLVLKKPILQWCGSFLGSLSYSGVYSLKPEQICLRNLQSYQWGSVNKSVKNLFLSLTHPVTQCLYAVHAGVRHVHADDCRNTQLFAAGYVKIRKSPSLFYIWVTYIILQRLIFRSTKTGPSCWELPHMVLGYWLEPLSEDALHTRGEFSRRCNQQSRSDMRISANMKRAALGFKNR